MRDERDAWADVLNASKESENKGPIPGAQALWKGLSILKLISEEQTPPRFSELQEVSGLPKATLHRIIQALIDFNLIRLDESEQSYRLGPLLFEMAHKVWSEFDLRGAAEPELLRIQKLSSETARLGILVNQDVLIIDQKDTSYPLRLAQGVGNRIQIHASAMGKAIMAHLPLGDLHELLDNKKLEKLTRNTITCVDELNRHLDLTKARGYAISIEEQYAGINSVAAPIIDHRGNAIGAVSLVGGSFSLPTDRLHSLGREVLEAARRISGNVGESFMSISAHRRPVTKSGNNWQLVFAAQAFLGEGPHWNVKEQNLEWVDILEPSAHILNVDTGKNTRYELPEIIGCMVPRSNGGHAAVSQYGYRTVSLSTGVLSPLASPENMQNLRFNDGKCDAKGRFWAGTLALDASPNKGALFCMSETGELKKVLDGLDISNGIGWNLDSTKMYVTDSGKRVIYEFDFDLENGSLSNQRIFVEIREQDGLPDGLAVDVEGGVWSTIWDGWRVIRYDKFGVVDRVVNLPVPRPTGCAFGGKDLTTLFVTSARIRLSAKTLAEAPLSGSIFSIEAGVAGVPVAEFSG